MGFSLNYSVFILFSCLIAFGTTTSEPSRLSGFCVPTKKLQPYDWTYIRVELPLNFSSATIAIDSDVNLDLKNMKKYSKERLPLICFRDGGPPLPDFSRASLKGLVSSHYNVSAGNIQYLRNVEQCYPLQKSVTFKMPYGETIIQAVHSRSLLCWPIQCGLGNIRTQLNVIKRGSIYSFSANVTVKGCLDPEKQGQYCDQTVENLKENLQSNGLVLNYTRNLCLVKMEPKIYSLDTSMPIQITAKAKDIRINRTLSSKNITITTGCDLSIMCYARCNAIPDKNFYDYSGDLSKSSLAIPVPKCSMWYFSIQAVYQPNVQKEKPEEEIEVCLLMEWEVNYCQDGKDGSNCAWEEHELQKVDQVNPTVPAIYLPDNKNQSLGSANFPLELLLSKSLYEEKSGYAWTYFFMWTYSAGENIHIQLLSDKTLDYEIYVRYYGVPTSELWDYRYSKQKIYGKKDSLFKFYNSTQERVNMYILYATEGCWVIGLRHPAHVKGPLSPHTTMSVSIKTCPNRCSDHGTCMNGTEASGSTSYGYCSCNRDYGGFDCSVDLRQKWHTFSLIATNVVAILPALRAFYQKEYPEWVVFMSSGISSALYHACDEHTYCVLKFSVLQFMDFWLSFLAVVSTFLYLSSVNQATKRTLHTFSAIITALLAVTGPTRPNNIPIVISLGALGILIGWLIELWTKIKSFSFPSRNWLHAPERWEIVKNRFFNTVEKIDKRSHWVFVLLGFTALAMAAVSRKVNSPESYWKWHSLWHVSIYLCALFFFCSKVGKRNGADGESLRRRAPYELAGTQAIFKDEGAKGSNGEAEATKLGQP